MPIAATVLLLVIASAAGLALRLVWSRFESNDARWILWILRRQHGRPWVRYELEDSIVPAELGYPVLFHWLISRLPARWWVPAGFVTNALMDLALAWLTFAAVVHAPLAPGLIGAGSRPTAGLVAAALVLFAPCLFPPTARLMAFNGRAFGLLVFFLLSGAVAGFTIAEGGAARAAWLAGAGAWLVVIVLSSQFAFQASVVALPALAIAAGSPWPVLGPALALVIAWAIAPLGVRAPWRYFLGLYRWQYGARKQNTTPHVRTQWLRRFFHALFKLRSWRQAWPWLLVHAPQPLSVLYFPVGLGLATALALDPGAAGVLWEDPIARGALAVTAAMTLAAAVTSFPPFSIFGQAERYVEYATPQAAGLLAVLWATGRAPGWLVVAVGALGLAVLGVNLWVTATLRRNRADAGDLTDERAMPAFSAWFAGSGRVLDILTVPMHRSQTLTDAVNRDGTVRVRTLYDWSSVHGEPALAHMTACLHGQHYTAASLRAAFDRYGCDGVLVFKREAHVWDGSTHRREPAAILAELAGVVTLAHEDERYAYYERVPASPGATP